MKKIVIILLTIIGLLSVSLFFMPKKMNIVVEQEVKASPEKVYESFSNLKKFNVFNQWMKIDPKNTKLQYGSLIEGKGAQYVWNNIVNTDEVGKGSLRILDARPSSKVVYEMLFGDDKSKGLNTISFTPSHNTTIVKWHFETEESPFFYRIFNFLFEDDVKKNIQQSINNLDKNIKQISQQTFFTSDIEKVSLPEMKIMGIVQQTSVSDAQEISMAVQESLGVMYSYLVDVTKLKFKKDFNNAIAVYNLRDESQNKSEIFIGFIINKDVPLGEGMKIKVVPSSQYIKAVHKGSYLDIAVPYNEIKEYAEKNKFKIIGNPIEIYKNDNRTSNQNKETEVYYPIQ